MEIDTSDLSNIQAQSPSQQHQMPTQPQPSNNTNNNGTYTTTNNNNNSNNTANGNSNLTNHQNTNGINNIMNTSNSNNNNAIIANAASGDELLQRSSQDLDIVRLIGQHLLNLGFKRTVDSLLEESKLGQLDHPAATRFMQHILNGDWAKADKTIDELSVFLNGNIEATLDEMRYLIAEQNFLELIEDGNYMKALKCLRLDLTPKQKDIQHIKRLTTYLMCKSSEEFKTKANWLGKGLVSRQKLMEKFHQYIPPSIMLPPNRLTNLIEQAIQLQREKCLLHNPETEPIDLKFDHHCHMDVTFPVETIQEIVSHDEEVWFCKFSNDGLKLATSGRKGKIFIWDLNPTTRSLKVRCELDSEAQAIINLAWSPNDNYLLACGSEEQPDCWIWNVQTQNIKNILRHSPEECMTTCSWHKSGELFAIGSLRGNFVIYDSDGTRKSSREGIRVHCLSFLNCDTKHILAADALNRIKLYELSNFSLESGEEDIVEEKYSIMSFCIDKDDHYIAINLSKQGVHLWDYRTRTLLRMFNGVSEQTFMIYSSFAPLDIKYLASGSEDGKIYIYKPDRSEYLVALEGHSKTVNCVTWNPVYPSLMVSGSDDRTIRLWGPYSH